MSKEIGVTYKTLTAEFSDDASIQEAFSLYHYGVTNYDQGGKTFSNNSIEGHFASIKGQVDTAVSLVGSLSTTVSNNFASTIKTTSLLATPNQIISATTGTVPLTIKSIINQESNLQEWKDSANNLLVSVNNSGNLYITNTLTNATFDNSNSSNIIFSRSRGSISVPTIIQNNDSIGNISFSGYDGANYIVAARIFAQSDGTPGTNDMPGRIIFSTTADGSATLIERMRIDSTGRIKIPANGILESPLSTTPVNSNYVLPSNLTDAAKLIEVNSSNPVTITIPSHSTAPYPIGTKIDILRVGAGEVTIVGATTPTSVTINSEGNKSKINSQWQAVTIIKRSENAWVLIGAIKT